MRLIHISPTDLCVRIKNKVKISGGSRIFPRGVRNSQKCYYFSIFCRKLHGNERIWTSGGRPWRPLGSATENRVTNISVDNVCNNRLASFIKILFNFLLAFRTLWNCGIMLLMPDKIKSRLNVRELTDGFSMCWIWMENLLQLEFCYRPQTKFREGNVFTSVCQEFCPQLMAATETRTVGKRAARILLECLFKDNYCPSLWIYPSVFDNFIFHSTSIKKLQSLKFHWKKYYRFFKWSFFILSDCMWFKNLANRLWPQTLTQDNVDNVSYGGGGKKELNWYF